MDSSEKINLQIKKFQKRKENFICEKCQTEVIGNGFTNHCPKCLYSKHVDINPGDRAEGCLGLMEPIKIEKNKKGFVIIHECQKCKILKPNRVEEQDDFDAVIAVVKKTHEIKK